MTKKTKYSLLAAAALAAANSASHAAIITLGTSQASAPTAVPTITVAPGAHFDLDIWAKAEGSGTAFVSGIALGIYQSTAASFNGGILSATNVLPDTTKVFNGVPTVTYSPDANNIFNGAGVPSTPNTAPTQPAGNTGVLVVSNIGGNMNTSTPPQASSRITNTQAQYIADINGTATSTLGTYYVYLGRNGTNAIAEFPNFKTSGSFVGTTNPTNTAVLGFGDTPIASAGPSSNNTLSPQADAVIVVASSGPTLSLTSAVDGNAVTIAGTGDKYSPALLLKADPGFILGGQPDTAGHTFIGFDFSGGTDYSNFFGTSLPAGATQVTDAAQLAALGNAFNGLPGTSFFDVFVDLGANVPQGTLTIGGTLPNGVTLNAVAAVPEPGTLSLAGIGAVIAMNRRRRQHA